MKIGAFSLMQNPSDRSEQDVYRNEIAQTLEAEKLGYDVMWFAEHHFSPYGIAANTHLNIAHVAALTKKIRLGTAITILPFMHPVRAAEEIAMLDILSDGRIDWGVGRGYQRHEFDAFEVPIEESKARFQEAVAIARKCWADEPFAHHGEFWNFDTVNVFPKPLQKPGVPMYMAATSPPSIAWAGAHGMHLLTDQFQPDSVLINTAKTFCGAAEEAGQDLAAKERICLRQIFVGKTREEARQIAAPGLLWYYQMIAKVGSPARHNEELPDSYETYKIFNTLTGMVANGGENFINMLMEQTAIVGTAEEVIDRLTTLHEGGYTGVIAWQNFGDIPHEQTLASMRRFADDVAPHLPS